MKLVLSIILGLLAALFAAVLVGALASGPDGSSSLTLGGGQVAISIAARDLEPGHVVDESDLEEQTVPGSLAESEGLLSRRSVIGRVLVRPVVRGQAVAASALAGRGTGPEIQSMLGEGLRATTVTLSDKGPATFVYPGSVVDVIAVLEIPRGASNAGQLVSRTVLEGVQVLAVDGYADASRLEAAEAARPRTNRGPIITLRLTPDQAQILQLARNLGTLSVTLRSKDDLDRTTGTTVTLNELLRFQMAARPSEKPSADSDEAGDERASGEASADDRSIVPATVVVPLDSGEEAVWEVTVIRSGSRSTYSFTDDEEAQE